MLVVNFTEFRLSLKKYLDLAESNEDTVIIKRGSGKGTVVISLEEYNSMKDALRVLVTGEAADEKLNPVE